MSHRSHDRRRAHRQRRVEEHGIVAVRIRPGHEATVIDVSADGALVETHHRLLPGTAVDLHLEAPHRRATIRGRVLRCAVARVRSTSVCYRGAIGFDRHLPWFVDEESAGYGVHPDERRGGVPGRATATPELV